MPRHTPEFTKVTIWSPHVRLRVHGNTPNKDSLGDGQLGGVCIGLKAIELDRERLRNLRGETEIEFVRNSKVLVDFEVRT